MEWKDSLSPKVSSLRSMVDFTLNKLDSCFCSFASCARLRDFIFWKARQFPQRSFEFNACSSLSQSWIAFLDNSSFIGSISSILRGDVMIWSSLGGKISKSSFEKGECIRSWSSKSWDFSGVEFFLTFQFSSFVVISHIC